MVGKTTRISPVKPLNTEIKTTELDENLGHVLFHVQALQ